jgi:hypothetical protein
MMSSNEIPNNPAASILFVSSLPRFENKIFTHKDALAYPINWEKYKQ